MEALHIVAILVLVSAAWTCSPEGWRPVHMDEMAFRSSTVVYGRVTDKFEDEYFSTAFSVEFEVKCIYKGGQMPSKINISNAGFSPGMCGDRNFTVGEEYIAFLIADGDGSYEPLFDETMEASSSMAELLSFCGLHLDYPSDKNNTGTCQNVQKDGCKKYTPESPPPPPVRPIIVPEPTVFKDPEGSGDVTSSKMDMTSSDMETTSMVKEASKTTSVAITSSETPVASKKSSEVIIVPIVTPENRDVTVNPSYGAYNGGNTVAFLSYTTSLVAMVMFWTLN